MMHFRGDDVPKSILSLNWFWMFMGMQTPDWMRAAAESWQHEEKA